MIFILIINFKFIMAKYIKDKANTDRIWGCDFTKEEINKSNIFVNPIKYEETTIKKDQDNSIDAYVNNIPVQFRFQDGKNKKNMKYSPTIRYKRIHSKKIGQKESEWFKIKKNRDENKEYPKYLIWGLVDNFENPRMFLDFKIIDINKLYINYNKKLYRILPDDKDDIIDSGDPYVADFRELYIKENKDKSSSFITLDEVYVEYSL